jgi:flagellar hook-associated protein 1
MSLATLLDVSRRSLEAATQAIRTTGDNVANVNTEGYSRRRVDFVTTSTGAGEQGVRAGTGVEIEQIERVVDGFINSEYLDRIADTSMAQIRQEYLSRAEAPFSLDNTPGHIGYQLNEFFSALEDLTTNPADTSLRTQVLERGEELVTTIREGYSQLSQLQRETDSRIGADVNEINRISSSIASINGQIVTNEYGTVQDSLTLRDQRDQLLRELSGYVSFDTVEDSSGQIMVSLSNGFALVSGRTSRDLSYVTDPSFAPAGGFPPALDGSPLGHIVYKYGDSAADSDLTRTIRSSSGEIAGLLALRGVYADNSAGQTTFEVDGDIVDVASRVEALARDLLVRFNGAYVGDTAGVPPVYGRDLDGNRADQPDGNPPSRPFALFSFEEAASLANYGDTDTDGLPEYADLNALVATGIFSFARNLTFNVTEERKLAAARAANAADTAPGDDANIQALLDLRDNEESYSLGNFSSTATIDGLSDSTTAHVGSLSRRAEDDYNAFRAREDQVKELQSSISGVNLDEEFAKLITYQRGYEASARMIRMADQLLSELMQVMG